MDLTLFYCRFLDTTVPEQLSLPILQIDSDTLANFNGENNALLLNSLRQQEQPFFYLWGAKGTGKTHLLRGLTNDALKAGKSAIYVPLSKSQYFSPLVLENLEIQHLVCLDDVQQVVGQSDWEIALFDLFNRIKASESRLVISADASPSALAVQLPDLASRLKWGEAYQVLPLSDEQKQAWLMQEAHSRGLLLSEETANFLFNRLDRDMATLKNTLDKLDAASLQAKRNLTIPFVKSILEL